MSYQGSCNEGTQHRLLFRNIEIMPELSFIPLLTWSTGVCLNLFQFFSVTKNDVAFDIYFLLEESDQVLSPDYAIMKDFVKMIMRT